MKLELMDKPLLFSDIDDSHLPYRSSKSARKEMTRLRVKYNLHFTHNPGGGCFYNDKWGSCQIGMNNDIDDYTKLYNWIAEQEAGR